MAWVLRCLEVWIGKVQWLVYVVVVAVVAVIAGPCLARLDPLAVEYQWCAARCIRVARSESNFNVSLVCLVLDQNPPSSRGAPLIGISSRALTECVRFKQATYIHTYIRSREHRHFKLNVCDTVSSTNHISYERVPEHFAKFLKPGGNTFALQGISNVVLAFT